MSLDQPQLAEKWGILAGKCLAPITASLSRKRGARMFHPDGLVFQANVEPCTFNPRLRPVAERLSGIALVRFSSALWRGGRALPDVLGAAIRFGWAPAQPQHPQQDLLLATIRHPLTMPLAPLATNFLSFLWNHYHAVSPFEVTGVGRVKIRLRAPRLLNGFEKSRAQHLRDVTRDGRAVFELEFRRLSVPPLARHWQPVVRLTLLGEFDADQAALRFSPFRAGAGIHPVGFVHSLRLAAYAASQGARPAHDAPAPGELRSAPP